MIALKMIHKCNNCEYQTSYKANYRRHIQNKHGIKQPHVDSDPVVSMEQTCWENDTILLALTFLASNKALALSVIVFSMS